MNIKKTPQGTAADPGRDSTDQGSENSPVAADPVMLAVLSAEIQPPGEVVNIVDLDEETKALIQTEFAQEEGGETQSAFFTGPAGGYAVAATGLGSALANYPSGGGSSGNETPQANPNQQAPEASGDASPFAALLGVLGNNGENNGRNVPASTETRTQTAESDSVILENNNPVLPGPENNACNDLNELLPLLTNNVNGISGQAATTDTAPLVNPTGTAPPTLL